MGLFNKKENVPEIPTAPTLPELPNLQAPEKKDLPELPSFPSNSKNENLNQELVKSAVADIPTFGENEVSVENPINSVATEGIGEARISPKPFAPESSIPELPTLNPMPVITSPTPMETLTPVSTKNKDDPIFVRIDKFQHAQKNFEQIKEKVKDIEEVLKEIKNTKEQEEIELKSWTESIEKIKSRLEEVDTGVFDQV